MSCCNSKVSRRQENVIQEYINCPKGERVTVNYFGTQTKPKSPEEQGLDVTHQNLLVDIILENELKTSDTDISSKRLQELAALIQEIFPNERQVRIGSACCI
ncbi:uncharacterized protein LOC117173693 [Belonocnema kinseyi]|uniref:uncharacterized protein LOC117173693 n=1 Tax=Belonocnema kinseyi TaxID=2817044 RepID=UPI00143D2094|nr:uncharacterized protein LOC117173693 [Belonocnema kinseyi]